MPQTEAATASHRLHYRGAGLVWAGRWVAAVFDMGSRRFDAGLATARRGVAAFVLLVYDRGGRTRAVWHGGGQARPLRRLFLLSGFPWVWLRPGHARAYKTLHFYLGLPKLAAENRLQFCDVPDAPPIYTVALAAPAQGDLAATEKAIAALASDGPRDPQDLPRLELALARAGGQGGDAHRIAQARIALYAAYLVNHRRAHALLRRWSAAEKAAGRADAARAFVAQLGQITQPLALAHHGYNPSFQHMDLAQVERDLTNFLSFLKQQGAQPFINSGTLLGYWRDGRPIVHDDDFDIAVIMTGDSLSDIFAAWRKIIAAITLKYDAIDKGNFLSVRIQGGVQVDIFPAWIDNNRLHVYPYCWADVGADAILPLADFPVRDVVLPVPADPDALLAVNYGPNWRVPDPFWTFDYRRARARFAPVRRLMKSRDLPAAD